MREWFDSLPPRVVANMLGVAGSVIIGFTNFFLFDLSCKAADAGKPWKGMLITLLALAIGVVGFGGGCGLWCAGMDMHIVAEVDESIERLEQEEEKPVEKPYKSVKPRSKIIPLSQAQHLEELAEMWWENELKKAAFENRRPIAEKFYVGMGHRKQEFVIRIRHWPDRSAFETDRFVENHILSECDYMQTRCDWIGERWSEWNYTIEEYKWDR